MANSTDLSRLQQEGKATGESERVAGRANPPAGGVLVLTLDDVLSRVPTRSLKPGLHDPARELLFAMDELLEGISRGRATIMLSKLAERYPETFEGPAEGSEDTAIYLPLQKLIQQIGRVSRRAPEKIVLPVAVEAPVVEQPVAKTAEPAPAPKPLRKLQVMMEPVDLEAFRTAAELIAKEAPATAPESGGKGDEISPVGKPDGAGAVNAESAGAGVAKVAEPDFSPRAELEPRDPLPVESSRPNPEEPPVETKAEKPMHEERKPLVFPPPLPAKPLEPSPPVIPPAAPSAAEPAPAPAAPPEAPAPPNPSMRPPAGRPIVRPPSIQGPAGLVATNTAPPASPAMPGFVFAPKASAPLSDFHQSPFPPETDLPEVHIPPLFPVHPTLAEEKRTASELPAVPEMKEGAPPLSEAEDGKDGKNGKDQPAEAVAERVPDAEAPETPTEEPPAEPFVAELAEEQDEKRQIAPAPRSEAVGRDADLHGPHFLLARIDQEPLQAIFMTEEFLDLPRVSQLSCGFPGITGCMIIAGDALAHSGERPAGLDADSLCHLTKQLSAVAKSFPEELPAVQTYTLHLGNRALSVFARPHVSLCFVHSHRGFLPGVRERLAAVADTLSRGLAGEAEGA